MNPSIKERFQHIIPPERISDNPVELSHYSRDLIPLYQLDIQAGQSPSPPALVIWPESTSEVAQILKVAQQEVIFITPYGAGSGVCGGAVPLNGGIVVDLKRMNRLEKLDKIALTITAQAGIIGEHLERWLNRQGYTLGHFPSSIYCSTLGGWVATRSAGQLSTRYGKIEDLVEGLEIVLPGGKVLDTTNSRFDNLPDLNQLFIGSEGTLGIITRVLLRISPLPQERIFRGIRFPTVGYGLRAIREIMQAGIRPAAVRLYDEVDTLLVGRGAGGVGGPGEDSSSLLSNLGKKIEKFAFTHPQWINRFLTMVAGWCLLVLTFEGDPEVVQAQQAVALDICAKFKGQDLGEAPGKRWWENRYAVSYNQSRVFTAGAMVDTIEVATIWSKLEELYQGIKRAISPYALVMAHFSHAYPEGCSIYFSFLAAAPDRIKKIDLYNRIWSEAMEATLSVGGTISHHHGIGLLKAPWMEAEHRGGMALYRAAKEALDPRGIMNPGKMGL